MQHARLSLRQRDAQLELGGSWIKMLTTMTTLVPGPSLTVDPVQHSRTTYSTVSLETRRLLSWNLHPCWFPRSSSPLGCGAQSRILMQRHLLCDLHGCPQFPDQIR